jgi:hypothetical protein
MWASCEARPLPTQQPGSSRWVECKPFEDQPENLTLRRPFVPPQTHLVIKSLQFITFFH